VLAGIGAVAAAAWWVGATAVGAGTTVAGGVALLPLVAVSAAGLGPVLWILSGATYLRIGAMVATPWRMRWMLDWKRLEVVLALALVTAGVVPILVIVGVEHLSAVISDTTLAERQVRFGAAAAALVIVAVAGVVGGRLIARPMAQLRSRVAALPLGPLAGTTDEVELSEFAEIGQAIDEASAALLRERQHKDELIATLQERNQELAAATAAKDEFLGMVSHELKTPITAILGYSELLARPGLARSDLIEDIRDESDRLGTVVDNLLALARLDAGRPAEPEPVLLQPLVTEAVRRTAARAPDRRLRADVPRSLIVEVVSDQLRIVLRNLLSNAIKYGDPAGEILVKACQEEDRVVVTLTDGGPGVPADQHEAVFEPFFRSPSTAATVAGMGIGLAVCRRIVEANGGRCWAESTDGGTAFKMSLPLAV
jgi:two-component system OmpR family sensor kinase